MVTTSTAALMLLANNTANTENYDYFDDDYSQFLVCQKKSIQAFGKVFLPVLYTLTCMLGLVGNILLFYILIKYVKKKRMMEVYLMNLAVSDLLFVITLPFWSVYIASDWVFGSELCKIVSAVYTMNFYSGIMFVTCMSLDKYLEIVHAWSNKNLRTLAKGSLVSLVIWTISILLAVPDLVFSRLQIHDGRRLCYPNYGEQNSVWKLLLKLLQIGLGFLLPFICLGFFYSRIACVLVIYGSQTKKRALQVVITLVAVYFVLWFPYNVVLFLHFLQDLHVNYGCETSKHIDYAIQVTESLAFTHCCLNPLLYAFVNKRFRLYINKIFLAVFRRRNILVYQSETNQSSSRHAEEELTSIQNL
ncbi:atypical chemokine receptor 2 [Rhinatrema bivittatum]|uniref:atypical chemokine receptor 2 n=1 Tax=Rhinatrema bivittatum TaxID=194408 RepID=UPI0011265440|nr:atypical chemokine receptor 2 [Rhinatrema bivittatum]